MKEIFIAFFILFYATFASSQDSAKKEVEKFISEKLNEYSYCSKKDNITNKHVISFNDTAMCIFNFKESGNYYTVIKVNDIDSVSIYEKEFNVWLIILLKKEKREITFLNSVPVKKSIGLYEILLNKTFLKEDLPNKMRHAFKSL